MVKLLFADLLDNARVWLGVLVIAAATAVVGAVVACDIETGLAAGGNVAYALYAISGLIIVFGVVTAVVVLGSVSALAITLHQRDYALWQLIGLRPGQVQAIVHGQLATLGVIGALLGCAIARPLVGPLFRYGLAESADFAGVQPRFGPVSAFLVVLVVLLLVTAGSSRGARRAGRTPVIQTLREADTPATAMNTRRWVAAGALLAIFAAVVTSLPGTERDRATVPLMLLAPLTAGFLVALGPLFLARLVAGWTALIPDALSGAWFLARNSTVTAIGRSAPIINALMVATALAGGLYAATDAGAAGGGSLSTGTVVLLLGGPLLLSLLGATVSIFMASRIRERETALVIATGATWLTVIGAAVAESLIFVGTAFGLGLGAVTTTLVAGSWLGGGGVSGLWSGSTAAAVLAIAGLGVLLTVPATVIPTVLALRQDVPRALAAE